MDKNLIVTPTLLNALLKCVNSKYSLSLEKSDICSLDFGMTTITIVTRDDNFTINWTTVFNNIEG